MKQIFICILFLFSSLGLADDLVEQLIKNDQSGYFPKHGNYQTFKALCNDKTCFNLVFVYYTTATKKGMHRLAVYSQHNKLLGVYSGLTALPIKVEGTKLIFAVPDDGVKLGYKIDFNASKPPTKVYLDGEWFSFESMQN